MTIMAVWLANHPLAQTAPLWWDVPWAFVSEETEVDNLVISTEIERNGCVAARSSTEAHTYPFFDIRIALNVAILIERHRRRLSKAEIKSLKRSLHVARTDGD